MNIVGGICLSTVNSPDFLPRNSMRSVVVSFLVVSLSFTLSSSATEKSTTADYAKNKDIYLIDTIKVVIYSEEGTDIITQSEMDRPGIDGAFKSLDDLVFERLMYMDAKRFKMLPDEESVDKHLQVVQKENNLTPEQLKNIFKSAGYTFEEGRAQFAMMTAIGSMLEFRIRSRLIVPEREITAYYNEHLILEPEAYQLERTVVPVEGVSKEEFKEKLKKFVTGQCSIAIIWGEPFWITKPELDENKSFISAMKPGQISEPQEIANGFELFRLKAIKPERAVPVEDRYREIANILRKPRYELLMKEYKKNLFDNASIIYF
jgi:parvulin-like peptidyl-prolyl isomerase